MKNFLYIFLITFLFNNFAYSASGDATEYRLTIYKIELCETGSTVANCLNPVTLFEGNSGTIDIANTTAGAQAAALGNPGSAILGKTYNATQVTMDRAITVAGYVAEGDDSCSTVASNSSTKAKNGLGDLSRSGTPVTPVAGIYYAGEAGAADLNVSDAWNAVSTDGTVDTDDDDNSANYQRLQWRTVLTSPVTITLGKTPTITIAFDPDGTIGFAGTITTHCEAAANDTTGLYVTNPKITITIAN
ncbi:hypothetical protein OAH69_02830 [Candidatus Pelagibacter sp.]|nr:hypothetical protein [Candidatus Pelagibacter sp.]